MRGGRSALKRLVERSLVALGGPAVLRALRGGSVILAYHNVVPDGAGAGGDRSLHLGRAAFARQLDLLVESHTVVDLPTLLGDGAGGRDGPLAAVTFDDGYRGALTAGLEELGARGLPCTVFVAPGLLGAARAWWDALAPDGGGGWPAELRREALDRAEGRQPAVWRWADERGLPRRPQPRHAGFVDESRLAEVAAREGVTIGSHGWSHANLETLGDDDLEEELARPLAWLEERVPGSLVRWLSLPYGRGDDRVLAAALEAGYEGVLDLSADLVDPDTVAATRRAPRRNVPAGISPEGFVLRAAGVP